MHLEVAAQGWVLSDLRRLGPAIPSNVIYNSTMNAISDGTPTLRCILHTITARALLIGQAPIRLADRYAIGSFYLGIFSPKKFCIRAT